MAIVGAMTAARTLLIKPVLGRVLRPAAAGPPEPIFTVPVIHKPLYLEHFFPPSIHNIFTIVAIAILVVFALRGLCDYLGDYLTNFVGFSAVKDLRNQVFEKVLRHGAAFFETTSTGRLMSSVMNDIDKSRWPAPICSPICCGKSSPRSTAARNLRNRLAPGAGQPYAFPLRALADRRLGKRIRRTSRKTQDAAGELNQVLQEAIAGHQVVKAFGAEKYEGRRFRAAADRLLRSNLRYVLIQGIPSPFIEMMGAVTFVALLWFGREEIKNRVLEPEAFMSFLAALLFLY